MLSIVMATHNGARTLPLTFEAMRRLTVPTEGIELIVVDNASRDETPRLLQNLTLPYPVRVVSEPVPGRTRALNRGVQQAAGDLIVITDDDVLPEPDWLMAYSSAKTRMPDTAVFSGQVRHFWQKQPPQWLESLAAEGLSYGGTPLGRRAGPAEPKEVKGANFAVRADLFRNHQFRPDVGYGSDGQMVAGDEVAFLYDLVQCGHRIEFVPEACLRHIVRPHEVGLRPVLRRYFRIGRGMAAIRPDRYGNLGPLIFGYPRYMYSLIARETLRSFWRLLRRGRLSACRNLINLAMNCGQCYENRRRQAKLANEVGGHSFDRGLRK